MGKYDEAEEYFDDLLTLPTARNEHLLDFATFMHSVGRLDDALGALEPFTESAPLGGPAIALRKVIKDQEKNKVAAAILADMEDDDDPGLIEPLTPGEPKDKKSSSEGEGAASASENAADGSQDGDQDKDKGQSKDKSKTKGWRGAIRSWFSRAISKKDS